MQEKWLMFAGALDERIALTIAQESGAVVLQPGEYQNLAVTWKNLEQRIITGLRKTCFNMQD
jgi:hypothetical protein